MAMVSAHRTGKVYRPGDPGFDEAWSANAREMMNEWCRRAEEIRRARMRSDPIYRAQEEATLTEYDRIFNTKSPPRAGEDQGGMKTDDNTPKIRACPPSNR